MSKDRIGDIVRALVAVPQERLGGLLDLTNKLGGQEGELYAQELKPFNLKRPCWQNLEVEPQSLPAPQPLLQFVSTVSLPPQPRFVAADRLVVNTTDQAGLKISYLSPNIQNWFGTLTEEAVDATELRVGRLTRKAKDDPIRKELGGPEAERVFFSQIFGFLATADHKLWYVFYALDGSGVLRAVDASWYGNGWDFNARPVDDPDGWSAGRHFVSRNS